VWVMRGGYHPPMIWLPCRGRNTEIEASVEVGHCQKLNRPATRRPVLRLNNSDVTPSLANLGLTCRELTGRYSRLCASTDRICVETKWIAPWGSIGFGNGTLRCADGGEEAGGRLIFCPTIKLCTFTVVVPTVVVPSEQTTTTNSSFRAPLTFPLHGVKIRGAKGQPFGVLFLSILS
jgi:hypothetical protein